MASIGMLGRFATSLVLWCLVHLHIELVRADDEVHATDLLQQKYLLHQNCGFAPGIHLVKLPKLQRQFAFVVPRGRVESSRGAPVFMFFHGVYQTPWFSINILGLPDMLERYGWFGVLPFGKHFQTEGSMGGLRQCCSDLCHSDECCLDARNITTQNQEAVCGFWPNELDKNLEMIDEIFQWMTGLGCIDTSKVFAGGFSYGATLVQDLACARSWQFRGLAPDVAPGDDEDQGLLHLGQCQNATPVTYVSFCGTKDIAHCYLNSLAKAETVANQTLCSRSEVRRESATVNCTVWSGCHAGHVVESCMVYRLDHEIPGRVAPDGTTFLHPGSDLDYTKYVFEKFSLQVASDQLRFYGHPTQAEEDWKQSVWPPKKMYDNGYLREALAGRGLLTLPNHRVSITSTIEYESMRASG